MSKDRYVPVFGGEEFGTPEILTHGLPLTYGKYLELADHVEVAVRRLHNIMGKDIDPEGAVPWIKDARAFLSKARAHIMWEQQLTTADGLVAVTRIHEEYPPPTWDRPICSEWHLPVYAADIDYRPPDFRVRRYRLDQKAYHQGCRAIVLSAGQCLPIGLASYSEEV